MVHLLHPTMRQIVESKSWRTLWLRTTLSFLPLKNLNVKSLDIVTRDCVIPRPSPRFFRKGLLYSKVVSLLPLFSSIDPYTFNLLETYISFGVRPARTQPFVVIRELLHFQVRCPTTSEVPPLRPSLLLTHTVPLSLLDYTQSRKDETDGPPGSDVVTGIKRIIQRKSNSSSSDRIIGKESGHRRKSNHKPTSTLRNFREAHDAPDLRRREATGKVGRGRMRDTRVEEWCDL